MAAAGGDVSALVKQREGENRALREQCQVLRQLLDQREAQATEQYGLLRARAQEGDQLWRQINHLQEQLDRLSLGLEPVPAQQPSSAPPSARALPTLAGQDERWASPRPAPAPSMTCVAGLDDLAYTESHLLDGIPGTPNARKVLSLMSMTPGPTMGTYAGPPLGPWCPPPVDAAAAAAWQAVSPAPTPTSQGLGLPGASPAPSPAAASLPSAPNTPSQATLPTAWLPTLVPNPPVHPAPVQGLGSPVRATTEPPERDASDGVAAELRSLPIDDVPTASEG